MSNRALKRRVTLAAKELGYRIKWSKQPGEGELYLQVIQVPVDGTSWRGSRHKRADIRA